MIKKKIPTWPWWLLGGKKEKETEALNRAKGKVTKRKELELESFGSSGSESVALSAASAAAVDEWSVGWTEPHGPSFQSDDEGDDGGFLVLVPCYRAVAEGSGNNQLVSAVKNLPNGLSPDGKNYMDQWFSSMQNL